MSLGNIGSNLEIIKVENEENTEKKNSPKGKSSSIPGRILKYVIPGVIITAGLSIITGGWSNFVIVPLCFGGFPQNIRKSLDELGFSASIKKFWNETSLEKKIMLVAVIAILAIIAAFKIAELLTLSGSSLVFVIIIAGLIGVSPGVLFSSQLCDPPLMDLSGFVLINY